MHKTVTIYSFQGRARSIYGTQDIKNAICCLYNFTDLILEYFKIPAKVPHLHTKILYMCLHEVHTYMVINFK